MNGVNMKIGSYVDIDGNEVNFNFVTSLNSYRKLLFVNSLSDALVDDNYNYVIYNLMFDYYIARLFTDVDFSYIDEINNKENAAEELMDAIEKIVNGTTIVDIVKLNADDGVIEELEKAVALNIEYRTGIHINPITESLSSLLNTVERKVADIDLDSMMESAQALSSISSELTPEKMLEAYANTDMFKNRYKESLDDKKSSDNIKVIKGGNKTTAPSPVLSPLYEV